MSPLWIEFDPLSLVHILPAFLLSWMILAAPVSGAGWR